MTAPSHPHDHDHPDIPEPEMTRVDDDVFAWIQLDGSWGLNNCGVLVAPDGVTAIDTCFTEARTRRFVDAVGELTDAPVRTLINTHHHGDHTHGNWLLPAATVIGHERCREEVLAAGHLATGLFEGVDWGRIDIRPPFVTFRDALTVWVDDREVQLLFVGPAHTTNDVVAWLPESRILFAGDLVFNGGTPFVVMGSVEGSLRALDRLRALEPETVVPGHGPVCGPAVLDDMVAYLRFVQQVAREHHDAGTPVLEVAESLDLGRFRAWHDTERIVGNLHRAYAECDGAPLGAPADPQAFTDMVTFNGGPLRCLA